MTIALILKSYLNNEKTIVNQRYIGTKSPKVLKRHREGRIYIRAAVSNTSTNHV